MVKIRNSRITSTLFAAFLALSLMQVIAAQHGEAQVISIDRSSLTSLQETNQPVGTTNQVRTTAVAPEGIGGVILSSGTLIAVHILEEPDFDGSYRIDEQGNIDFPYLGEVHLGGLKLFEAESAMIGHLTASGILKVAHVTVNVIEYSAKNITVLGEVKLPGTFPVLGSRPLSDVLAMAGGVTELAGDEIDVHRADQDPAVVEKIEYRHSLGDSSISKMKIYPGDVVSVERTGIVYVLGSVLRPGGYPMQEGGRLNVSEALALAMGPTPDAKTNSIRILRKLSDGSIQIISLSYKAMKNGPQSAIALRGEDILFVPNSRIKDTLDFSKSVFSSASSAAIYVYR